MPPDDKPTAFRPALDDETLGMLDDFCAAHHEANKTEVVRKAVRAFIQDDVSGNQTVRAVYDALQQARAKRRAVASTPSTAGKPDAPKQRPRS